MRLAAILPLVGLVAAVMAPSREQERAAPLVLTTQARKPFAPAVG